MPIEINVNLKTQIIILRLSNSLKSALLPPSLKCFRLYSKYRFKSFTPQAPSQILTRPMQEICMVSKLAVPFNTSITDLISRAAESPPFSELRIAINHLKLVDALDTWEDMSELGVHVINMGVDMRLAKMIVFACALRCLEPIVSLAATLVVGEPCKSIFNK